MCAAKIKFPTKFNIKSVFPTKKTFAGERMQPTYKMTVDENGVRELKKTGQIDLYAQIQSFKDSCDINYILERFAKGDVSALSKIQGVYGDFMNMPRTMAELSQRVIDAENLFNTLPLDVRQQFNFSPSEFFASIGSDKFNAIFADEDKPDFTPSEPAPADATEPIKEKGEVQ